MSRILTSRIKGVFLSGKPYIVVVTLLAFGLIALGFGPFQMRAVHSASAAGETVAAAPHRQLSLEERVKYQRRVEEVYWRHTTWPEQSATAKPGLDEISTLEATRAKVEDTLRKSEALAKLWKRPITAEQLQAEMQRMARESKQPKVLRELHAALNNDPFLIAEILARPVLVERLARNSYADDERFHGALRARAADELRALDSVEGMRQMGGQYSEVVAVKVEKKRSRTANSEEQGAEAMFVKENMALKLTPAEWDAETARLAAMFEMPGEEQFTAHAGSAKLLKNRVSNLQEDANGFYVTSVVEKTDSRLKVARVDWPKRSFDSWWAEARNSYQAKVAPAENINYQNTEINQTSSGADDTWTPTSALPVATNPLWPSTVVWTGTEMIVWGGQTSLGGRTNSGARYNPATDTWTPTSTINAPRERRAHSAVWTGTEMIIWGGCSPSSDFCGLGDGGRYNPATDTWTPVSTTHSPASQSTHTAVWTGSKMITWGGCSHNYNNRCNSLNVGGVYDPATDTWKPTSGTGAPSARSSHRAVWTGSEMIIWGSSNTGGRYNPETNTWKPTETFNAPNARAGFTMVWTGSEMVVWGGYEANTATLNTGGRYNPATNSWTPTSTAGAPAPRYSHTSIWTGSEMIVFGGDLRSVNNNQEATNTGGRYNPATDSWTQTSTLNAPVKIDPQAVWTGAEMIVWSGSNNKTGGRYNPLTDSWTPTNNNDSPVAVELGVWSGTELLVWGPIPGGSSGGRYNPATYSWTPMNTTNSPSPISGGTALWTGSEMLVWTSDGARYNPQTDSWTRIQTAGAPVGGKAVWTGAEMIVWGGQGSGRYNPSSNSWSPISTANAPSARNYFTSVWTGTEMIVWGGSESGTGVHFNNGARYNPSTDSWTPTSTANAPTPRRFHKAVWTGNEMVVWGGMTGDYSNGAGFLNTGGRYNPATNSWQPTSLVGAPSPRIDHTAIWTGSQMIVWGGNSNTGLYMPGVYTGARYSPLADAWTPTSTRSAPSARTRHVSVWTGTGMLIWGGIVEDGTATHGAIYHAHGSAAGNVPPSLSITGPANGAVFESGANININADATDGDGSVSTVHFYANNTLIGTDSIAPFNFTWNEVRGGSYSLTAVATDNSGGVANSSPVTINVNVSTAPPICALASPTNGATYTAPADVPIAADARANRDRTLTKVEFFDGDRAVGTYTNGPYGYTWTNIPEGTHTFYVRCTDSAGSVTTSPTSVVTINPSATMYRVTGQITNSSGSAMPNLRVRLDGPQSTAPVYATTNLNGYFQFYSLTSGASYTVTPESTNYSFSPASRSYAAMSHNDDNANFVATQIGYSIGGRLTDAGGQPLYPATINLSGSATASTVTDVNGNYYFSNLAPGGNYTVQPYKNQHNFTPPYRTFNNLSAHQTADFTATTTQKQTPTITWNNPADITYGTTLSAVQLNATASVPGSFSYTPAAGTLLNTVLGQTLKVSFTPADSATYNSTTKTVLINVLKATPVITWTRPADITSSTPLTTTQLNATANVPGTFTYTPAAGTVLPAGLNTALSVSFTPADTINYSAASAVVHINVNPPAFILLTEENSQQAAALDALTLTRGPFPVMTRDSSGQLTPNRIMLFAKDLQLSEGESASVLTIEAEDSQGRIYQLEVEAVLTVQGFEWLTQVNVILPQELAGAGEVWVRGNLRGKSSNRALIAIKP